MNLYTYVDGREGLIRDVVALLLAEVEMPEDPGITWEEAVVLIADSLRAMALRHPHAFVFVALARYDEPSVVRYARRIDRTLVRLGFPERLLPKLATILDAHGTGFLLLETQLANDAAAQRTDPFEHTQGASALLESRIDSRQAFEEGTRTIVAGFKLRYGLPDGEYQAGLKH